MIGRTRIVGLGGKPLKSELHHWWPRGISRLWMDEEGNVTRLSWNGQELRRPPAKFGAINNAHHIKISGPWAGTIEPMFNDADHHLPLIAVQLEGLSYREAGSDPSFMKRIVPQDFDRVQKDHFCEGIASLLVRCPAHRNLLHTTTEAIWSRFDGEMRKRDDSLIALNINQHYRQIVASIQGAAKIVVLRSREREFIFGEGYLNTLMGYTVELTYRCLLPLTPNMAVLGFSPRHYKTPYSVFTMGLSPNEVDLINDVTQLYSQDYVFYRRTAPRITKEFKERNFMSLQSHSFHWLERLMADVSSYT